MTIKTFVAAMVLAFIPVPIFAQNCDSLVVDNAKVFGGDTAKVEAAASALAGAGADVRVRTFTTMENSATLDQFERTIENGCPSWQAPDGGRKNNLLVLMAAVGNHKVGLYYGSQWKRALDTRWPSIQSDFMAPRFRDRDFAGGFVNGMQQIGQFIDAANHVSTSSPTTVVVPPVEAPTDFSGLWVVLGWCLGLGVLGFVIWLITRSIRERNRRREEVTGARQRAIIAKQGAEALMVESAPTMDIFKASSPDVQRLKKVEGLINAASESIGSLNQLAGSDPNQRDLSAAQYDAIANPYNEALARLRMAKRLMQNPSAPLEVASEKETPEQMEQRFQERHRRGRDSNRGNRYEAPTVVNNETVVYGNPVPIVPVIINENERREDEIRSYVNDHGSSSSHGSTRSSSSDDDSSSSSSSGGGSTDWVSSSSSSSDSGGGSIDFGSSDSGGGGGSSDW